MKGRAFNVYLSAELAELIDRRRNQGQKVNLSATLRRALVDELELDRLCEHQALECTSCGVHLDRRADVETPVVVELTHALGHRFYGGDPVLFSQDAFGVVHLAVERRGFDVGPMPRWDHRPLFRRAVHPTSMAAAYIADEKASAVRSALAHAGVDDPVPLPTPAAVDDSRRRHPTARPSDNETGDNSQDRTEEAA